MRGPNKRITSVAFTLLILLSVFSVVQVGSAGSSLATTAQAGEQTIDEARGYVDSMSTVLSGDSDKTPPQAVVDVPDRVMVNESVTLTAKNISDDTGVKHVYWHFDSQRAAKGANATGSFAEPGVRSATLLLVDEAGNRNMITRQVFVLSDKPPEASLSAPKTAEAGKSVTLDASDTVVHNPIEYYSWDFDGDGKADRKTTKATVTHAYTTTGDHQPTVTVVDMIGMKDQATAKVSVVDTTPPTATLHVPETVVVNESFDVRATKVTDASGIEHVCWFFDGVEGPDRKTATHTFTSTGTHNVTLSLKDGADNWNKITVTVNVVNKSEAGAGTGSTTISDEKKDDSWVDVHRKAHKNDQKSEKTTTKTTKTTKKPSGEDSTERQTDDGSTTTADDGTTASDGTTDDSWADANEKAQSDEQETAQESAAQESSDVTTTTEDVPTESTTTETSSSDGEVTTVLETVDDGDSVDDSESTDTFGQPGFGVLVSLIAFAGAAFVALRRR